MSKEADAAREYNRKIDEVVAHSSPEQYSMAFLLGEIAKNLRAIRSDTLDLATRA